jgi:hypothetical protein
VRQRLDLLEHLLDARLVGRVGDLAVLDRDDDLLLVAGRRRRVLLQQVDRVEAVGAAELELVAVVVADTGQQSADHDKTGDPADQDDPAAAEAPACKCAHGGVRLLGGCGEGAGVVFSVTPCSEP